MSCVTDIQTDLGPWLSDPIEAEIFCHNFVTNVDCLSQVEFSKPGLVASSAKTSPTKPSNKCIGPRLNLKTIPLPKFSFEQIIPLNLCKSTVYVENNFKESRSHPFVS